MKVIVDLKALKALALIMPKNDIRWYLNTIHVKATNSVTTMVVTDGHMLGVFPKEQENTVSDSVEFSIPYDIVMQLIKLPAKSVKQMFPGGRVSINLSGKWADVNL